MKNVLMAIYDLFRPVIPVILLLLGGLGVIYSISIGTSKSLLILSMGFLLLGMSIYTYQQAMNSEFFKRRFGSKSKKSKDKRRRRSGKRCPQCERIIYHRRSACQHCGHEFASHKKESDDSDESESAEIPS